jgi:hypothetical protein
MASAATPYGLKPVKRLDGMPYAGAITQYLIDPAGEATNIYNGSIVILGADGYVAISTATGADTTTNNLGGNSIGALGVFVGCSYENAFGRQFSNHYPTGQNYNSTPIYAHVVDDPFVLFQAQLDSTGVQTIIGTNTLLPTVQSTSTGDLTTGISNTALDATVQTTTSCFRIVAHVSDPADSFVDVLVVFNALGHRYTNSVGL